MNSKFTMIVRVLLGIMLVVFGANKLFPFLPMPEPAGAASAFMSSLNATGYIFPVLGILEVTIGLMLLFKKWVPFAIILLAPISINILLFHLFLAIPGVGLALLVAVLNAILIYKHWRLYNPLFA
ncbi:MAG: DoxX family membrane protein [Flavobacterium sp.]|uniref:DoxX family membrane protein n=1 Tax=Flavobacterium sp. TaxID=239 RepID=UPI0011FFB382|nr:DoxX family membrane protein [Flavobacterium sp.]RZJ66870.1 MAG: DoxX family membrane protein [Flavobacterium sp.]